MEELPARYCKKVLGGGEINCPKKSCKGILKKLSESSGEVYSANCYEKIMTYKCSENIKHIFWLSYDEIC